MENIKLFNEISKIHLTDKAKKCKKVFETSIKKLILVIFIPIVLMTFDLSSDLDLSWRWCPRFFSLRRHRLGVVRLLLSFTTGLVRGPLVLSPGLAMCCFTTANWSLIDGLQMFWRKRLQTPKLIFLIINSTCWNQGCCLRRCWHRASHHRHHANTIQRTYKWRKDRATPTEKFEN